MFDERFRRQFGARAEPAARLLVRAGVTPNAITITSFAASCLAAGLVGGGHPVAGIVVWIVSRIGDGLDGVVARVGGHKSAFGGFLDITLDMAAYSAMVIGFARLHSDQVVAWTAVLAGYVIVITTTLALSDAANTSGRQISATNRTFQFTAGLTEAGETTAMYLAWVFVPSEVWWLVWLWVIALLVTAVQRVLLARRVLRS